ncbi:MAG: hypothetical protein KIT22_00065 [Verrucomicrobiae bacterium]|nr:hypothetical protein [Verrucomicrobiae bacterium]
MRGVRLMLAFLAILAMPALIQGVLEVRGGEWPFALDVFRRWPTAANLRQYEDRLKEESRVANGLRPWAQWALYVLVRDAGDKGLLGPNGWWFYRPGVSVLTQRPPPSTGRNEVAEAIQAILHFRDQLAKRGIRLVVMPAPNKESVYPEQLVSGWNGPIARPLSRLTHELMDGLRSNAVEVVDLFQALGAAKAADPQSAPLYLRQDSHWSPEGIEHAVRAVAKHLREGQASDAAAARFTEQAARVARHGDVVRMLRSPPIERTLASEAVECVRILRGQDREPFQSDPNAEILVLGDSFLRIFEQDEPGAAGFISHLAKELNQPIAALVADGGASTLVRQELHGRPALLEGTRVVIWEFVERDIRLGTEGWQQVPLPPIVRATATVPGSL